MFTRAKPPRRTNDQGTLVCRRKLFAALLISATAAHADVAKPEDVAFLEARLIRKTLLQRRKALPFSPNQLYYPAWLFGEYQVSSILCKKTFPLGTKFVPARMGGGTFRSGSEDIGDVLEMNARYFSTLADSFENNLRVNLGLGIPSASIIEDRIYNALQLSEAVADNGRPRVRDATYDPRVDAQLLTLFYSDDRKDKAEVHVINRLSSAASESRWLSSESFQLQATSGDAEYEQIMELRLLENGTVVGRQRTAVYLPASNPLRGQANGQAVAIYDYDLTFRRRSDEDGSVCVDTPKGYRQCQPDRKSVV